MSQAEDRAGLIIDLEQLAKGGSGSDVLETCATLLLLRPVSLAIEGGALGAVAARTLLEIVAQRASARQTYVRAAAALTGIDPPDTNRGVKGEPRLQRLKRAGNILGIKERAMRERPRQLRCYQEYAEAVLGFVRTAGQDHTLMDSFLLQCGARRDQVTVPPPQSRSDHSQLPGRAAAIVPGYGAYNARQIPLSGLVRQALDAARISCEARGRPFYTPDLLLALIDMPRGRVSTCFDQVEAGMSSRVRARLAQTIQHMSAHPPHPFQPFEWSERPDVQLGQDLAAADGAAAVNDVYLLLGILGSESGTRAQLAAFLGPGFDRLQVVANASRHDLPQVLLTPGLDHGFSDVEEPRS